MQLQIRIQCAGAGSTCQHAHIHLLKRGPGGEIEKGVTRIQDRQSGAVNKALNFNKLPTEARANWHHEAGRQ